MVNLEIGFLTPPLGLNLVVVMTAFRESFFEICRAALPIIASIIAVLLVVTFVPQAIPFLVDGVTNGIHLSLAAKLSKEVGPLCGAAHFQVGETECDQFYP